MDPTELVCPHPLEEPHGGGHPAVGWRAAAGGAPPAACEEHVLLYGVVLHRHGDLDQHALPPVLVASLAQLLQRVFCPDPIDHLRRRRNHVGEELVLVPPCTPPKLRRHRHRPAQHQKRPLLQPHGLDDPHPPHQGCQGNQGEQARRVAQQADCAMADAALLQALHPGRLDPA